MHESESDLSLAIAPERTLAELATTLPGASRVFHRHGLDFCCDGRRTVADACARQRIDAATLIAELRDDARRTHDFRDWSASDSHELIDHIVAAYHEPHRVEVERLLGMATKVERVHADKADCPHGLAELLTTVRNEMEEHMRKEEQILFPAIRAGQARMAAPAVRVMEQEHEDHGRRLERLRQLTSEYVPPAAACNTWRALYLGLAEFERELMEHIHLENHVLFPRALG